MPICAAMSPIGRSVARRAISMAGGSGTGIDHARRCRIRAGDDGNVGEPAYARATRTGQWPEGTSCGAPAPGGAPP